MFMDSANAANDISDKFARCLSHVAKKVIALHCYLGAKAYHFKKLVEGDEEVTRLTESVKISIVDRDNKSYLKVFLKSQHRDEWGCI